MLYSYRSIFFQAETLESSTWKKNIIHHMLSISTNPLITNEYSIYLNSSVKTFVKGTSRLHKRTVMKAPGRYNHQMNYHNECWDIFPWNLRLSSYGTYQFWHNEESTYKSTISEITEKQLPLEVSASKSPTVLMLSLSPNC